MAGLAAGLGRKGYDVRMVASRAAGPTEIDFKEELDRLGLDARLAPAAAAVNVDELSRQVEDELEGEERALPVWWFAGLARPFARAILEFRPSVVHGWIDRFAIVTGLVACTLGVPRIIIGQTSITPAARGYPDADLLRGAYRALAKNPSVGFVNVSARCAEAHEDWLNLERGKIRAIYTALMPGTVRAPRAQEVSEFRRQLGISESTPVVGTVMRLEEPKDPLLWLDTAEAVAKVRPDVRFIIAGDGTLKGSIEQHVETRGLQHRVFLTGPAYDVGLIYATLDVFLMTSSVEGLPNTLIEAQAAGRPVVSTDVGGTREAVLEGTTGLIATERSPSMLAGAILSILGNADWSKVKIVGPEFVERRFGYERKLAETIALYGFRE
jgi:glycosyltransferase involved in cell wall biosynthesis